MPNAKETSEKLCALKDKRKQIINALQEMCEEEESLIAACDHALVDGQKLMTRQAGSGPGWTARVCFVCDRIVSWGEEKP